MQNRLLLIDALNLIRRIYAGIPTEDSPEKAQQCQRQSLNKILRLCKTLQATHAVVVFDGQGESWRHELYPQYKAHRSAMPEPLASQLPALKQDFTAHHLAIYQPQSMEADDVIATLAVKNASHHGESIILSTDQGYGQLLSSSNGISQYDAFNQRWLDAEFYHQRHGVSPQRMPQLVALTGHSSTGIPGVSGIGPKTALSLLSDFADLDALLEAANSGQLAERWRKKLLEQQQAAKLSLELACLRTDLSLGINLRTLRLAEKTS